MLLKMQEIVLMINKSNLSNRNIHDIRKKLYRKEIVYYALTRGDTLSCFKEKRHVII